MAYYEDLSDCDYFVRGETFSLLKAIGWLERDKPYPKGTVTETFFYQALPTIT